MTASRPETVARLNVNLVEGADIALSAEQRASGMNRADVTNRALQLYHAIACELRQSNEIHIYNPATKTYFKLTIEEASA